MKNWIFLSYPLNPESPAYGGGQGFIEQKDKQIDQGDSCNTSHWSLSSHMGTHLDFPRHFSAQGQTLDAYDAGFFQFSRVTIKDISLTDPGQIITPDHLNLAADIKDTELLIIKTGFGKFRGEQLYWQQNPGFHPDLAGYLRQELPDLRVLGFDSISLSSFANRELGRTAHKAFLDHDKPILPLEDMDLEQINGAIHIEQVIIAPLRVSSADGAPCTVMAKI